MRVVFYCCLINLRRFGCFSRMENNDTIEFQPDVHKLLLDQYRLLYPENGDLIFQQTLHALTVPPLFTVLRVNILQESRPVIREKLQEVLNAQYQSQDTPPLIAEDHPLLPDVVYIQGRGPDDTLTKQAKEVIVDPFCGMAVLRGANVFAQGVMGAPANMQVGDIVSVYADVEGTCRKGSVAMFQGKRLFVGNGQAKMSRQDIFKTAEKVSGVAVEMSAPLYLSPSLADVLPDLVFPQNLPSILCSHVLDPQPGERVLDMCAAPGGKTTHIATLMKNQGLVIAFDKSQNKIDKIIKNAALWNLTCIQPYVFDGTKSCDKNADLGGPPPYPPESFDRILVDGPCSALGQRPCFRNPMKVKELKSYPTYQRKLLSQAVDLLRPGGTLIYSTCTITLDENEKQVAWLLKENPTLRCDPQSPYIGISGKSGTSLTNEQLHCLQRFEPCSLHVHVAAKKDIEVNSDTIGFFIAKFVKESVT